MTKPPASGQVVHSAGVIFDDTGILTEGRFGVTGTVALADVPEEAEALGEFPIARGIVDEARRRDRADRDRGGRAGEAATVIVAINALLVR